MFSIPALVRSTTIAAFALLLSAPAHADRFDDMRLAWFNNVTGRTEEPKNDPVIAAARKGLDDGAKGVWDSLKAAKPFKATCFVDMTFGNSPAVTAAHKRVNTLARAYWARGGALEGNIELRADILAALDWLYTNQYNDDTKPVGNWWDWEIGTPIQLDTTVILMYDFLSPTQVANYLRPIDRFSMKYTGTKGGANGAWVSIITALRAVAVKDEAKLKYARDEFSGLTANIPAEVTKGDGFYADGSYIGHYYYSYTGSYGLYFLQSLADGYFLMGPRSLYPMPDAKRAVAYGWIKNSYWPLMFRGQMAFFALGREVGRGQVGNRSNMVAAAIIQLVGTDTSPKAKTMLRMAKRIFIAGGERYGTALGEVVRFKALMNDPTIVPLSDPTQTTIFSAMDKAVALRPGWGIGVSYYSPRIYNYEDGRENMRGWHQSDGMVFLNNADSDQYNGNFWPTIDSHRLAGTTVVRGSEATAMRPNGDPLAGGAQLDRFYAALGFTLKPEYAPALVANKAWFVFDSEVVCLGAGITSTGGKEIETVIENRKLNPEGTNAFTVDGQPQPKMGPWTTTFNNAHWMHLAGRTPGSDIGTVFPTPTKLDVVREARTDSWRSIHFEGPEKPVTETFLTAVTSQGTDPTNASYAYILLPNRTVAAVAAYASRPTVSILANTPSVSAARQNAEGVTGAIFWKDEAAQVVLPDGATLKCDQKAAVVLREANGQLDLALSDPTKLNDGTIEVEFSRPVQGTVSIEPGITVLQQTPTLKLRVDVKGAKGKSFHAKFAMLR